jgi:membrane-bound hydrogenase subunit beta
MEKEEALKTELEAKFSYLKDKVKITRQKRLFSDYLPQEEFKSVFDYAVKNLQFVHLCTITGLDEIEFFGFVYHLARQDGIVFNLKSSVAKDNPVIETITGYFPGGAIYEHELEDLLGVKVQGLPEGNKYPLPEGWPEGQHPLRKDWNPDVLKQEEVSPHV